MILPRLTWHAAARMLSLTLILSGCATTTDFGASDGHSARDVACGAFRPVTWSAADTSETIRQVKAHNAVYRTLCSQMIAAAPEPPR